MLRTLADELALELVEELERELVLWRERLLADDGLHRGRVASDGVLGVLRGGRETTTTSAPRIGHTHRHLQTRARTHQLVRDVAVVLAGELLANGALHETRERGEHVDRWVYLPVVQLPVDEDLALRDVPGEIGNGVRDI